MRLRLCAAPGGGPRSVPRLRAILFVGDVVGSAGRRSPAPCSPALREELGADFVVVNGENAAGGIGITPKHADELFRAGADAITLGNHTYRHREIWPYLDERAARSCARPTSSPTQPGRGTATVERGGVTLGVVNLSRQPVHAAGRARRFWRSTTRSREVERAPTTSSSTCTPRRRARRSRSAGTWTARSTAVVGTHTHVPTADARVLPGGTAYITDVGMTGARGGVIGVRREQSIATMRTHMPQRYEPSEEDPWLNAVLVRCSEQRPGDGDRADAAAAAGVSSAISSSGRNQTR